MNLGKGTLILTVSSLIFMLSGYLINIILGKVLGPENYGSYGLVIAALSLINIIQTAGLPQSLAKTLAKADKDHEKILGSAIRLQLVITLALTLMFATLAHPIAKLLGDDNLIPLLYVSSLVFPIYSIYAIYSGYYNGMRNFKRQSFLNITYSISKLALVVFLAMNYGVIGAIVGFAVSPLITLLLNVKSLPQLRSKYPWKELLNLSTPLIAFALFSTMLLSIDIFVLKFYTLNNAEIGYYSAAQNIARIPYYALNAVALVLFPSIAKLIHENRHDEISLTVKKALRIVLIILFFISGLMLISSETLIKSLFTPEYRPGSCSLEILLVGYGLLLVFTIFATILSSANHAILSVKIAIASLIITLIFCSILINKYGINGAALGTFTGGLFAFSVSYYFIRKIYQVQLPYVTISKVVACTAIALIPTLFLNDTILGMMIGWVFSSCVYIAMLYTTKEIKTSEIVYFQKIIKGFRK